MVVKCERCGKELGEVPAEELFIGGHVCDDDCTKKEGDEEQEADVVGGSFFFN